LFLLTFGRSIAELECLLNKESWHDAMKNSEVNATLQVFMNTFCHYFNTEFACKSVCVSKWITQGTKTSSKSMCFVNTKKKISQRDHRII